MVRIKTGMIVTRGWQVVELWFGGGAYSCKSGAKAPHSKLGRGCGTGQYTGKGGQYARRPWTAAVMSSVWGRMASSSLGW